MIGKLFETIVNRALRRHLKSLICPEQHGFIPGRSTMRNLACYTEIITKAFDEKAQVHSVYTDFSKCFDVISHPLLLLKMKRQFGIDNNYLNWFHLYLTGRYQ